jgi:hypothetical protein
VLAALAFVLAVLARIASSVIAHVVGKPAQVEMAVGH